MISPHKSGRRAAALWQLLNRREAVVARLKDREASTFNTREKARQCRALRREIAKLTARAERQAQKIAAH